MPSPLDQSRYQVRFERGVDGLARLAASDVVVVVDVLRASASAIVPDSVTHAATEAMTDAAARGETVASDDSAPAGSDDAVAVAGVAEASGAVVLAGSLRNASAVAAAVAAEQAGRGARTSVAVIAVGDAAEPPSPASTRAAVEDDLGAGAIIDALGALGIDHTSPEAAVVGEGFRGLRRALTHLLTASGSGQAMLERGGADDVRAAAQLDATDLVPVFRDGRFSG